MPYRTIGVDEIARYLHLTSADIQRLVKNRDIPFERHGEHLVFRKVEIDAWASQRILGLQGKRLAEYHDVSSRDSRPILAHDTMLPEMIRPEFVEPDLPAKTKASVLREMVNLAERTGRLNDPKGFLEGLQAREQLCSTGLPGGLALLHTRWPDAYLFDAPFLLLGRTTQNIFFGAPDGGPTRLFFLIGCPDDRLHLHTLARLCVMAQKTQLLAELHQAADAAEMFDLIIGAEEAVLQVVSR